MDILLCTIMAYQWGREHSRNNSGASDVDSVGVNRKILEHHILMLRGSDVVLSCRNEGYVIYVSGSQVHSDNVGTTQSDKLGTFVTNIQRQCGSNID